MTHTLHTRAVLGALGVAVFALGFAFMAQPAEAATLTVGNATGTDYTSIQDAVDAASSEDTINIGPGTFTEAVDVDKNLTFIGAGETQTFIDAAGTSGYGFSDNDEGVAVVIKNLTLKNAGHYGIKFSGGSAYITNVTVSGSDRTEFDFNGMTAVTLTNVTADGQNTAGNGISFTDSENITIDTAETSGNVWGGVALYATGKYYDAGINGVDIQGLSADEANPLYKQVSDGSVNGLTAPQFTHTVQNDTFRSPSNSDSEQFTFYQQSANDAVAYAAGLPTPENSTVKEIASGNFVVGAGMSVQKAIDVATDGDTIVLNANNTIDSDIDVTKDVSIDGQGNTISADFAKTDNSNNSSISIGASGSGSTIKNLTVDGTDGTDLHGINVYTATDILVENVSALNFRTGILVNGSTVTVDNITTSGNAWHAINADLGSGVTQPAKLTVLGNNSHGENSPNPINEFEDGVSVPHIFIDDVSKDVTVTADGYLSGEVAFRGATATVFTLSDDSDENDDDNSGSSGGGGERISLSDDGGGSGSGSSEEDDTEGEVLGAATSTASTTDELRERVAQLVESSNSLITLILALDADERVAVHGDVRAFLAALIEVLQQMSERIGEDA